MGGGRGVPGYDGEKSGVVMTWGVGVAPEAPFRRLSARRRREKNWIFVFHNDFFTSGRGGVRKWHVIIARHHIRKIDDVRGGGVSKFWHVIKIDQNDDVGGGGVSEIKQNLMTSFRNVP